MKLIYHDAKGYLNIDFFVNPLPGIAIVIMTLNDHIFKQNFPSAFTGKLSDFMGLFYFPLFICALFILVVNSVRIVTKQKQKMELNRLMLGGAVILAGGLMVMVNTHREISMGIELLFAKYLFKIHLTPDISDLWSLVMLPLTYLYGRKFICAAEARNANASIIEKI